MFLLRTFLVVFFCLFTWRPWNVVNLSKLSIQLGTWYAAYHTWVDPIADQGFCSDLAKWANSEARHKRICRALAKINFRNPTSCQNIFFFHCFFLIPTITRTRERGQVIIKRFWGHLRSRNYTSRRSLQLMRRGEDCSEKINVFFWQQKTTFGPNLISLHFRPQFFRRPFNAFLHRVCHINLPRAHKGLSLYLNFEVALTSLTLDSFEDSVLNRDSTCTSSPPSSTPSMPSPWPDPSSWLWAPSSSPTSPSSPNIYIIYIIYIKLQPTQRLV